MVALIPGLADAAKLSNPYRLNKKTNKSVALTQKTDNKVVDIKTEEKPVVKKAKKSEKGKWYIGVHADLSFLNWKNEYEENGLDVGSDSFKFKSAFGAGISFGYDFGNSWRSDIELGYLGKYSESETENISGYLTEKTDFSLSTSYGLVNGYYDLYRGMYVGVGTGVAVVKVSVESTIAGSTSKQIYSPMGDVALGYRYKFNNNTSLDMRYRFMVYSGPKMKIFDVDTEIGLITDNMISLGINYMF